MPGLKEKLRQIDELQEKIASYGKLDKPILDRINYRFRLDWNYHSNIMEGNSLTKEETRSIMVRNIDVKGKPLKDVLEMKGHDEVITSLLQIGKGDARLSEKRIMDIHRAIMHEENPEQQKKIGQWKNVNNHIINYKGEKFDFTPHPEVPEKMHELLNKTNAAVDAIVSGKKDAPHPAIVAFEFHLRYISIHPFYDGNGRTCRIFTNLLLIAFGYPPVIIRLDEKTRYYQYLADIQGYGGSPDLFYGFMADLLIRSQQLVLDVIEGRPIDESDELTKEIELLRRKIEVREGEVVKSSEVLKELWDNSLKYFIEKILEESKKFDVLFVSADFNMTYKISRSIYPFHNTQELIGLLNSVWGMQENLDLIRIERNFSNMKRYGNSASFHTEIRFSSVEYSIIDYRGTTITKNYSELLSKTEIDNFIAQSGKKFLNELNSQRQK